MECVELNWLCKHTHTQQVFTCLRLEIKTLRRSCESVESQHLRHHNNVIDFVLVSVLITLSMFLTLFWCFYCWLSTVKKGQKQPSSGFVLNWIKQVFPLTSRVIFTVNRYECLMEKNTIRFCCSKPSKKRYLAKLYWFLKKSDETLDELQDTHNMQRYIKFYYTVVSPIFVKYWITVKLGDIKKPLESIFQMPFAMYLVIFEKELWT